MYIYICNYIYIHSGSITCLCLVMCICLVRFLHKYPVRSFNSRSSTTNNKSLTAVMIKIGCSVLQNQLALWHIRRFRKGIYMQKHREAGSFSETPNICVPISSIPHAWLQDAMMFFVMSMAGGMSSFNENSSFPDLLFHAEADISNPNLLGGTADSGWGETRITPRFKQVLSK